MSETGLSLDFILSATGGVAARRRATTFPGVTIDGRAVPPGGLWFAIRGERFDGHDFAGQAVAGGAAGIVVARDRLAEFSGPPDHITVIGVDDTVRALGALARAHRE